MGSNAKNPDPVERISDGFDAAIRESRRLRSEIGGTLELEREMAQFRESLGTRRRSRPPRPTDGGDDLTG